MSVPQNSYAETDEIGLMTLVQPKGTTTTVTAEDAELELGRTFAESFATKDLSAIEGLLHPDITFRALVPGKAPDGSHVWESHSAKGVTADVLQKWFEMTTHSEMIKFDLDKVGDRNRVSYRLSTIYDNKKTVVEQQAYYSVKDGKISWMSLVCSGLRPAP